MRCRRVAGSRAPTGQQVCENDDERSLKECSERDNGYRITRGGREVWVWRIWGGDNAVGSEVGREWFGPFLRDAPRIPFPPNAPWSRASNTKHTLGSLASPALRTLRLNYKASGSDLHCFKEQAHALEVHRPSHAHGPSRSLCYDRMYYGTIRCLPRLDALHRSAMAGRASSQDIPVSVQHPQPSPPRAQGDAD